MFIADILETIWTTIIDYFLTYVLDWVTCLLDSILGTATC